MSSLAWVEARSGSCGPEAGRRRFKISIIGIFENWNLLVFFWVEHVWNSGRVRRRRDADKWNMLGMIRMWSERGKCDGKVQNIKGNALVPDFATCLSFAYPGLAPILIIGVSN